jgi:hypothetical protein
MSAVTGKTYSLFSNSPTSDQYFQTVRELTDFLLEKFDLNESDLLQIIKTGTKKKRFGNKNEKLEFISNDLKNRMSKYTPGVKKYLRSMSLLQRFDATLRTKENQYFLYMLEIELVNRIYIDRFKQADFKMALLPHCLRDFRPRCLSVAGDIEHVCQGCTKDCNIHLGSKLLTQHRIEPYISVTMDQKKLFQELKNRYPKMAALGIACIPELARGIRLCLSIDIPAIGIPLDVNRCARWMGKAYETSFNLKELEKLIEPGKK